MACFGKLFTKKKRGERKISSANNESSKHSPKIGEFWEFSYFLYDEETGNIEKMKACQPKPQGKQIELLLKVTRRGEKGAGVDHDTPEKNLNVVEKGVETLTLSSSEQIKNDKNRESTVRNLDDKGGNNSERAGNWNEVDSQTANNLTMERLQ